MIYLLIQHQVRNYAKWRTYFDQNGQARNAQGSKGGYIYCDVDDPNKITIIFEWDDFEHAREFAQSDDLHKIMKEAGVIGEPNVRYLEKVDQISE